MGGGSGGAGEGGLAVDGPGHDHAILGASGASNRLHVTGAVGAGGPRKGLAFTKPKHSGVGAAGADQHVFTGDQTLTEGEGQVHLTLPVDAQGGHLVDDLGGLDAEAPHRGTALIEFHNQNGFTVLTRDGIVQPVHLDHSLVVDGDEDRSAVEGHVEDLHGLLRIQLSGPLPDARFGDAREEDQTMVTGRGFRKGQRGSEGGVARQSSGSSTGTAGDQEVTVGQHADSIDGVRSVHGGDHAAVGPRAVWVGPRHKTVEVVRRRVGFEGIQIVLEAHPTGEGPRDHHALTAAGQVVRDVVTKASRRQGPARALRAFFGDRSRQPEAGREQANQQNGDPTHMLCWDLLRIKGGPHACEGMMASVQVPKRGRVDAPAAHARA